jgi:uncharacterized Zn finger protein
VIRRPSSFVVYCTQKREKEHQVTNLPQLSKSDVRSWTDQGSFVRGTSYFDQGRILNPRLQGRTLKARCLGSAPQPYSVEITLADAGVAAGHCSCPVGAGGHCKHAVALLLTWLDDSDAFLKVEEVQTVLEGRSKAELIELIQRMIARYPDLETLLELPVVGEIGEVPPVNAELIRRQAESAFYDIDPGDWNALHRAAQELDGLVDLGVDYAARESWHDAATIYRIVVDETLESFGMMDGEEGELIGVVDRCVSGLGACLEGTSDPAQREVLLRALFDVYHWDVDFGGIDMGHEATDSLLEGTSAEEKALVAHWVRDALPSGGSWSEGWRREMHGGFLLQLEADRLDDEAYLRICRETGRLVDLVDRLLALDRVEEAATEVRRAGDYDLLQAAGVLVAHDQGGLAERLVRERMPHSQDTRLPAWLTDRAVARGDLAEALRLAEMLFWQRPRVEGYQEVKDLARSLHTWPALRITLLARLAQEEQYALLTAIHLAEGEIDAALASLEQVRQQRWGEWGSRSLSVEVARAAEETRPQAAIGLYMQQVERLIGARGRGNYAEAASYLQRVRDLLDRLGEAHGWQALIAALREHHRRLPALQDELHKAGL